MYPNVITDALKGINTVGMVGTHRRTGRTARKGVPIELGPVVRRTLGFAVRTANLGIFGWWHQSTGISGIYGNQSENSLKVA